MTEAQETIEMPSAAASSTTTRTRNLPVPSTPLIGEARAPAPMADLPLDQALHAGMARITGGLAPGALLGGFFDWATHLATSPGKQIELAT